MALQTIFRGIRRLPGYRGKCNFIEHGLHPTLEETLNQQVNTELKAAYSYLALEAYFKNLTVSLTGFARMNEKSALEEQQHAKKLIELITQRGGTVIFSDVKAMETQNWATPLDAMKDTLKLENATALGLVGVIEAARSVSDIHVEQYIHDEMLSEQMECIYEVKKLISIMKSCKSLECLMMIDEKLQQI